jgi:S1-C subfamily serine protease
MATEFEVLAAKETAVQRYFTRAINKFGAFAASSVPEINVVGVGVGMKTRRGVETGFLSVRFYVERKLPAKAIAEDALLPTEIGGIPTDVVETGVFQRLPNAGVAPALATPNQQKFRPAEPGCSCGFRFPPGTNLVMAGTLGAIVSDVSGQYILSNNHVLADEGKIAIGSPIFQPGLLDGGNVATDMIARLSQFVPISTTAMNHVDCAIAKVTSPDIVSPVFLPSVGKLSSNNVFAPSVNLKVMKTGRTTGFTTGVITDIHATVKVQYDAGVCQFDEQILIVGDAGSFSAAGDSGSLIVASETKQGTGLLFAGSASHTIANRLDAVLAALGVGLVV